MEVESKVFVVREPEVTVDVNVATYVLEIFITVHKTWRHADNQEGRTVKSTRPILLQKCSVT